MRLNDEKLGILRSQEDLSSFGCAKKKQQQQQQQQSHEEASCNAEGGGGGSEYASESPVAAAPHYLMLTKQNSFEHDESLGILTPDQMTDFTVALESSRTPSCENLSGHANQGKFLLGKSSAVVAAAARHLDITACAPSIEAFVPPSDRSPSLEELPLDPVVAVGEDVELLEDTFCIVDTIPLARDQPVSPKKLATDSTETSENTSEQVRSVGSGHVLPTSFITSVTSITSLEAGYQGDGENSRPASRGPEPLSVVPVSNLLVSATSRQDPMTDSDFFTESDADAHEEIVRGDRRAQVIDGTLFCKPSDRRCQGFEHGEEMDSSGIYSDLDKRQDSAGVDGESYGDGDHTTDTGDTEVSMRSQLSPDKPVPALVTKNFLSPQVILNETHDINSPITSMAEVTVIKCQKNEQNTVTKSKSNVNNKENSAPLKKHKMPKRNVSSKIKTMLESNQNIVKEEPESEPRRCQRQQRKTGRWDAVMNKIEAGKTRGRSLKKEVKSRVLQGLGTSTSSTASTSSTRRAVEDANNNANKDKRRARGRAEPTSPNQETARSSVRSSASDLSSAHSKEPLKRLSRNNNQLNGNLHKSNLASVRKPASIKTVQSNVNAKQKNATTNKVADRNASNIRAIPAAGKELPACPNGLNNLHHNHINNNNGGGPNNNNNNNNHHHHHHLNHVGTPSEVLPIIAVPQILETKPETREQEVQVDGQPSPGLEFEVASRQRAEEAVQALAVTVQYLTQQLEEEGVDGRLRKDLEKTKADWLSAHSELEELRLRKAGIEETVQSLRDELEHELSQRSGLEQSLLEERSRADSLQESLAERQREQRMALERLAQEHEAALAAAAAAGPQVAAPPDQVALLAEVESLRTVLELRSRENGHLRSEVDILRRELDEKELVKQRCECLEARCEDLKAQLESKEAFERQLAHDNEVLMGSLHQMSKQNKRLSQKNEELLWRLRQKNEVVSVLTNQLTPQSQRLSKSLGPEQTDHQPADSNCTPKSEAQSCSMVRYMVEKGDSVSWTLDITESADSGSICTKSPSPATRRYHENNGSFVSRQGSLRLATPRRSTGGLARARSNSVSVAETAARTEEPVWSPSFNSTPLQRRRNVVGSSEQNWSLSNSVAETMSTSNSCSSGGGNNIGCKNAPTCNKVMAVDISTTDEDEEEEEVLGQRPQEAGGEAMISEETSATSSSEDESSVSSSDIP